jgi:hypothetical protein
LGSRSLRPSERRSASPNGPPDAFALFCACHLGITPEDAYQRPHLDEVARRFGMTVESLKGQLVAFGIDEATVRKTSFDLEGAQLDVRVVPEGISRVEMARGLFEEYLEARQDA